MRVNGAIQALVTEGKLLRTKKATIIKTDVFKRMIVEVLKQLDCDTQEVFERRDNQATTTLIEVKTRLCLPFDSGSSHDEAFKVLQNFLSIADHSPIFIDFPVILMM